jgi:hypothetical protein
LAYSNSGPAHVGSYDGELFSLGGPAAVDGDGCAGDVAGGVGGKEDDDAFDFLHLAAVALKVFEMRAIRFRLWKGIY